MVDILKKVETVRRLCPVIFLLDTSGSMSGAPIGAVNAAIENVLPELVTMNESNSDNEIKLGIMRFDSDIVWVTGNELVSPESLSGNWTSLDADGLTSMGEAFRELNNKLSVSHGFMQQASGSVAPVLFLLSDGEPTDDYQYHLKELKKNNWYKVAAKVAIGYGEFNDNVLYEFTGNRETVLHTDNPNDLKKLIRFVAITSSRVASSGNGGTVDDDNLTDPDDNTQKTANALHNQGGSLANADADEDWN